MSLVCMRVGSLLLALLVLSAPTTAATSPRVAAVVARTLAYVRTLKARAGARVDLLVVTPRTEAATATEAFRPLAGVSVQGLPLSVHVAAPTSAQELRAVIESRAPEAVLVDLPEAAAETALFPVVRELAQKRSFLVIVRHRSWLAAGGVLAVAEEEGRTKLVVSLPSARAAGIELAAELLQLAEVQR